MYISMIYCIYTVLNIPTLSHSNKIFTVCAALSNLFTKIYLDVKLLSWLEWLKFELLYRYCYLRFIQYFHPMYSYAGYKAVIKTKASYFMIQDCGIIRLTWQSYVIIILQIVIAPFKKPKSHLNPIPSYRIYSSLHYNVGIVGNILFSRNYKLFSLYQFCN